MHFLFGITLANKHNASKIFKSRVEPYIWKHGEKIFKDADLNNWKEEIVTILTNMNIYGQKKHKEREREGAIEQPKKPNQNY